MANHKRGKPKSARAGCLMCKPWKFKAGERKASDRKRYIKEHGYEEL